MEHLLKVMVEKKRPQEKFPGPWYGSDWLLSGSFCERGEARKNSGK
jgi:hypothetical protein